MAKVYNSGFLGDILVKKKVILIGKGHLYRELINKLEINMTKGKMKNTKIH